MSRGLSLVRVLVRHAVALLLAAGSPAGAQPAGVGAVLLQVKPHAGDTIRVRLDQSVEIAGVPGGDGSAKQQSESGSLVLLALLAVASVDPEGATVVSQADSVRVNATPGSAPAAVLAWAASAAGRAIRFRVAPNGSAWVPSGRGRAPAAGPLAAQMPATLPARPISPGTSWNSTLEVPLASSMDPGGSAALDATFTFDSLSRSGELAFLSVRGRLMKAGTDAASDRSSIETSGTVTGTVLLDRRRGWITDARTTFSLQSLVTPADPSRPPVKVRMTISQWLRAM